MEFQGLDGVLCDLVEAPRALLSTRRGLTCLDDRVSQGARVESAAVSAGRGASER
jgi:hypothetical protein